MYPREFIADPPISLITLITFFLISGVEIQGREGYYRKKKREKIHTIGRRAEGSGGDMNALQKINLRQKVTDRLAASAQARSTAFPTSSIFKDKTLIEISLLPLSRPKPAGGASGCVPRQTLLSCFLQLPPELQFKILSYLDYGEIQRLRRTNRLFRRSITPLVIQSLLPNLLDDILSTCYLCLTQKDASVVVRGEYAHPRFPFASRCVECLARRSGLMVGQRYTLTSLESVFVCRWCGIPVTHLTGWHQPEFHIVCYQKYKGTLATHFGIGALQWMVVIVGSALCWHYFRHDMMVVVPVAVSEFDVVILSSRL